VDDYIVGAILRETFRMKKGVMIGCPEGQLFRELEPLKYVNWMPVFQELLSLGAIGYSGGRVVCLVPDFAPLQTKISVKEYLVSYRYKAKTSDLEPVTEGFAKNTSSERNGEYGKLGNSALRREIRNAKERERYRNQQLTEEKRLARNRRLAVSNKIWKATWPPGEMRRLTNVQVECKKCRVFKKGDGSDDLGGFSPDNSRYTGWERRCRWCRRKPKPIPLAGG
jgi:hypothetical protein